MTLEEGFVDRHRLDRNDPRLGIEALDAIDEQHRITMRQRRHHPPDIKRGGAAGRIRHFGLAALRLLLDRGRRGDAR
jgi:hypothetical protein